VDGWCYEFTHENSTRLLGVADLTRSIKDHVCAYELVRTGPFRSFSILYGTRDLAMALNAAVMVRRTVTIILALAVQVVQGLLWNCSAMRECGAVLTGGCDDKEDC
jgi:hypothetical protein